MVINLWLWASNESKSWNNFIDIFPFDIYTGTVELGKHCNCEFITGASKHFPAKTHFRVKCKQINNQN